MLYIFKLKIINQKCINVLNTVSQREVFQYFSISEGEFPPQMSECMFLTYTSY